MRRTRAKLLIGTIAAAAVALTSSMASAAVVQGGNAGGGTFATQAAKLPLIGPKGTGLTRGVTSTSINVGCVYTAADYAGYTAGIEARFARANKAGGIYRAQDQPGVVQGRQLHGPDQRGGRAAAGQPGQRLRVCCP